MEGQYNTRSPGKLKNNCFFILRPSFLEVPKFSEYIIQKSSYILLNWSTMFLQTLFQELIHHQSSNIRHEAYPLDRKLLIK